MLGVDFNVVNQSSHTSLVSSVGTGVVCCNTDSKNNVGLCNLDTVGMVPSFLFPATFEKL